MPMSVPGMPIATTPLVPMQRSRDVVLMSNDHFTRRTKLHGAHERLTNYLLPPIALAVGIGVLTPTISNADDTPGTAQATPLVLADATNAAVATDTAAGSDGGSASLD